MLLLSHKGNLNNLNQYNQTPLAFSSDKFLQMLNLKDGVCTVTNSSSNVMTFNNNKLLKLG